MNFSQLMNLAAGHVEARIVQTAVELRIFDVLDNEPLGAEAVAAKLGLNAAATELLMNALVALNVLEKQDQAFSLAPIARQFLRQNSAQYLGAMIRFESSLWHCWEQLPQAIRSGKAARPADMYQLDPTETEVFIQADRRPIRSAFATVFPGSAPRSSTCRRRSILPNATFATPV